MTLNYCFSRRWQSLIRLDRIRLTRLLEMIQFAMIYGILLFGSALLLDRAIEPLFPPEDSPWTWHRWLWELAACLLQVVLNVLVLFYLRKLAVLIPPLINLEPTQYMANWHDHESSGEMALALVGVGVQTHLLGRLAAIRRQLWKGKQ